MRPLRILRRAAVTILALAFVLFAFVQFQQRLLRHRAEKLHAEIVALQLHPGTFADIQRLQKEWGRFGHYDGECTQHHCIYTIILRDFLSAHDTNFEKPVPTWLENFFSWLGGRRVFAGGDIHVRDNRMWGENFDLSIGVSEKDTSLFRAARRDKWLTLFVGITSGPRMFTPSEMVHSDALARGYRIGFLGSCTGCIGAQISITPQATRSDIQWLTYVNFSCITRWQPCLDEDELLPKAWPRRRYEDFGGNPATLDLHSASVEALGREAPNAAVAQVLAAVQDNGKDPYGASVRIVSRLKNAEGEVPGMVVAMPVETANMVTGIHGESSVTPGQRYIFIYREPHGDVDRGFELEAVIPENAENMRLFLKGVAADPSVGEPYECCQSGRFQ